MLRKAIYMAILAASLGTSAQADELLVDGVARDTAGKHPQRGLQKSSVAENFGEPAGRKQAVGEPPISSWEYDEFVVFFENDLVLHTVAKR
jgi:hypothetical protein